MARAKSASPASARVRPLVDAVIVVTAAAAMGFGFFSEVVRGVALSGVVRGDAVLFFGLVARFVRDLVTCVCGVVLVGCCSTAPDGELRGVEDTGAGSGEGVCTGVSAEVLAAGAGSGAGSGAGASTVVELGR
jgi:hypothetical protein